MIFPIADEFDWERSDPARHEINSGRVEKRC